MKEYDKNSQDKTNQEEIVYPIKEFRVIIVKMSQNIGNKMEAQINILEAQIEKIQKMFNKGLEN